MCAVDEGKSAWLSEWRRPFGIFSLKHTTLWCGISLSLILLNFSRSWCQHWYVWHRKAGRCNPGSYITVVHQMSFGRTCADRRLEVEYKWSILGRPWKWTFISLEDVFPSCQLSGCRVTISTLSLCFPPVAKQQCLNQGAVCKKDPNKSINSSALHNHAKEFCKLYFILIFNFKQT